MWDALIRAMSALITMGLPIALFVFLRHKVQATWRLIGIGAVTFIASQVVHIPLNTFFLLPLLTKLGLSAEATGSSLWMFAIPLGTFVTLILPSSQQSPSLLTTRARITLIALSAGVCEEVSRYLVYRYCLSRHERRFNAAVSLGGGHGGCEALLVGVSLLAAFIILSIDRHKDPDKMSPEMRKAIYDYWALPWSKVLMAPILPHECLCPGLAGLSQK
jgi:uncharacterized membrane protein YhfC